MDSLSGLIDDVQGITWAGKLLSIAALTVGAMILAAVLRRAFVRLYWRRAAQRQRRGDRARQVDSLKREQTVVKIIESVVRWGIFAVLAVLVLGIVSADATNAIFGASIAVVVLGFGAQQLMTDVVAGVFLLFEDRISVGDVILVPGHNVEGVVIDFGLRATTVRALDGTVSMVLNGRIWGLHRVSRGVRVFDVEALVRDADAGRAAAERSFRQLPGPPEAWLASPVVAVEPVDGQVRSAPDPESDAASDVWAPAPARVRIRLLVVPTREPLAREAFPVVLARELGPDLLDDVQAWPVDSATLEAIRETAVTPGS